MIEILSLYSSDYKIWRRIIKKLSIETKNIALKTKIQFFSTETMDHLTKLCSIFSVYNLHKCVLLKKNELLLQLNDGSLKNVTLLSGKTVR